MYVCIYIYIAQKWEWLQKDLHAQEVAEIALNPKQPAVAKFRIEYMVDDMLFQPSWWNKIMIQIMYYLIQIWPYYTFNIHH